MLSCVEVVFAEYVERGCKTVGLSTLQNEEISVGYWRVKVETFGNGILGNTCTNMSWRLQVKCKNDSVIKDVNMDDFVEIDNKAYFSPDATEFLKCILFHLDITIVLQGGFTVVFWVCSRL